MGVTSESSTGPSVYTKTPPRKESHSPRLPDDRFRGLYLKYRTSHSIWGSDASACGCSCSAARIKPPLIAQTGFNVRGGFNRVLFKQATRNFYPAFIFPLNVYDLRRAFPQKRHPPKEYTLNTTSAGSRGDNRPRDLKLFALTEGALVFLAPFRGPL